MINEHKTIVLLSCVATKLDHAAPARELYDSPLFKKSLAYAESLDPDTIYILSAKHYVLPLHKIIDPYEKTLLNIPAEEVKEWAERVIQILGHKFDLDNDKFIILAGDKYRKYITPYMKHWSAPLAGMRIGEQLQWYTKKLGQMIKEALNKFIKWLNF